MAGGQGALLSAGILDRAGSSSSSSGGFLVAAVGPVGVLGAVLVVDPFGGLDLSKLTVGPGPSYGSFGLCGLLKDFIMSCVKPIGLFGGFDGVGADACGPVRVLAEVVGARVGGPVRVLVDEVVLGAGGFGPVLGAGGCGPVLGLEPVGVFGKKKLSEVSMTGENLIVVFLASLQASFVSFSSSDS